MTESAFALQAQTALTQGQALPKAAKSANIDQMRRVAQQFESMFLGQVLKPMFDGLKNEAPFGGGFAEEMWRTLQVDEYGKAIARAGGIGIADAVLGHMLKMQEVQ